MVSLGIIGLSEGNGHPFSFSTIINGFVDKKLANSGWDIIYEYVKKRDISEFGFHDIKVTHAWTEDIETTKLLCDACLIPNMVTRLEDMIGTVDGVLIARDDYEKHYEMALPFLETGHHVFIDKPLTTNIQELKKFEPYLKKGLLMSCSGMRYAVELDEIKSNLSDFGTIKFINAICPNSWEKYAVHLIEAIFSVINSRPLYVMNLRTSHSSNIVMLEDNSYIMINNIENGLKDFKLDFISSKKIANFNINDNFSMFRRMLWHFIQMVNTNKSSIPTEITMNIMRVLIAGRISQLEKRKVYIDEIN